VVNRACWQSPAAEDTFRTSAPGFSLTAIDSPLADALKERYLLEKELGRGGMATVYLARDLRHDRPVALKVLRPDLAASVGAERFLREIKLAARLQHPHIVPVHDSGNADGLLYYVMPYLAGDSLRHRLAGSRMLPVAEALRIARDVAAALDYAHRHDVVHRDIKPENILLHEEHVLVADFGIGKALSAAGGDKLTETGMSLGAPGRGSARRTTSRPSRSRPRRSTAARTSTRWAASCTRCSSASRPSPG
jgi:serine/threonine protein kinase